MCGDNELSALPPLGASLRRFECEGNAIQALPTLPLSLEQLDCGANQLTALPDKLVCRINNITELPQLPPDLTVLDCEHQILRALKFLPKPPPRLEYLYCSHTGLQVLHHELPETLTHLFCTGNGMFSMPRLPLTLKQLECDAKALDATNDFSLLTSLESFRVQSAAEEMVTLR